MPDQSSAMGTRTSLAERIRAAFKARDEEALNDALDNVHVHLPGPSGAAPSEGDNTPPPVVPDQGGEELEPSWVTAGLEDLGFHEVGDNQGIELFIAQAKCGNPGDPWCAIWANAKLEQRGIRGTRSASSQSFRDDPNFVELDRPALGAIAVYWRGSPDSGLGHVGFYMGETATQILTLGGNESDAVRKQFEPKSKLRGYWWPRSVPLPEGGVIEVTSEDGNPTGTVT
jgi:uncharacterized protein (TIGR02594 family)